tara:strand:+ start:331 stop:663 length:333 start_codon:yes stop_codon:yes gene_type:complete
MKKPKILISICIILSLSGSIVFGNSLQNYNNADAVADYVKPIIRKKCGDYDYSCISNLIGSATDNARENIRYREQIESAATKNMLLGAILFLAGIFGAYYFNNIYIKDEK